MFSNVSWVFLNIFFDNWSGTEFQKDFPQKNLQKSAFFTQNPANLCMQKLDQNIVFFKNAKYFRRKSLILEIIAYTPDDHEEQFVCKVWWHIVLREKLC
jgi:hypothetical protein